MLNLFKRSANISVNKPDFIIVGAQKAGTTALHRILNGHSKIEGAKDKELHYFDQDPFVVKKEHAAYHEHFKGLKAGCVYFESTPSYLYHFDAASRIFQYNPKMKIIVSLRNPASRALSAWTMYHHHFEHDPVNSVYYDKRSFAEAIEEELRSYEKDTWANNKRSYINRGIYHQQIKKYLEFFSPENMLIVESNELSKKQDETVKKVCVFLNLPLEELKGLRGNESTVDNKNEYPEVMEKLNKFYKPHNEKLFELINKRYDW